MKKIVYSFSVIAIALLIGTSLNFAKAWTEPTLAPPSQNIGAPLNASATSQVKTGALGLGIGAASPVSQLDIKSSLANIPAVSFRDPVSGVVNFEIKPLGSNIYLGLDSGENDTGSSDNVVIGKGALQDNATNASANVGMGNNVFRKAKYDTASFNTAIGNRAMARNLFGRSNVAIGEAALFSIGKNEGEAGGWASSSTRNVAVGNSALYFAEGGADNVAIGFGAENGGAYNWFTTAVGSSSLDSGGDSSVAIGYGASEGMYATNSVAIGYRAGSYDASVAAGYDAYAWGNGSIAIGFGSRALNSNTIAIGANSIANADNKVRIGNTNVTVIEGQVPWSVSSDLRLKHEIKDSDLGLEFINKLRPVSYKLNNGNEGIDYGFIAQEVEAAIGKPTNIIMTDNTSEKMKTMRYDDLISPMVKAIQEQQQQINELKSQIQILTAK